MSWGYLVLAPDSFGPRGTKAVCTTAGVVTPNMRISDIAGALDYLATRVAKWWLPDEVLFVDSLPHTATGKVFKTKLREEYRDYRLPTA